MTCLVGLSSGSSVSLTLVSKFREVNMCLCAIQREVLLKLYVLWLQRSLVCKVRGCSGV